MHHTKILLWFMSRSVLPVFTSRNFMISGFFMISRNFMITFR